MQIPTPTTNDPIVSDLITNGQIQVESMFVPATYEKLKSVLEKFLHVKTGTEFDAAKLAPSNTMGTQVTLNTTANTTGMTVTPLSSVDPKLNELFCIWDFCDRVTLNGFYNYFVPDTSMIKETAYIDYYVTNKADYLKTISLRSKETFFPIFQPTEITPIVIEKLKKKIPCSIQYSQKLGAIVFAKDNLNSSDIIVLASILKEYNLDLDLLPSSLFEQTILKSSLIGIIR